MCQQYRCGQEARALWHSFGDLDAALQDPEEAFTRGLEPQHQLRELRQKFGDGEAEQGSPYRFFSAPPSAVAGALFPEAAARRKQFEEEGFVSAAAASTNVCSHFDPCPLLGDRLSSKGCCRGAICAHWRR